MANVRHFQGESDNYSEKQMEVSDTFGKNHESAGKPRKSSADKDALYVRIKLVRESDGAVFGGSATLVSPFGSI